jgi:hypothetical protein
MLDNDERPGAEQAADAFRDQPIPQFWDADQKYGSEVARSLGADGWIAWDIYLFFPPGVEWTDAGMPKAEAVLAQVGGVTIASKGLLPAVELENHIPKRLRASVDIVGPESESDIEGLLARVATAFAQKYASSP